MSDYPIETVQHPELGHWCGYVVLPPDHPMVGKDYDDIPVDVHGGLTYADDHVPRQERVQGWVVGFDCAHLGDHVPGLSNYPGIGGGDRYWGEADVKAEARKLAKQLYEMTLIEDKGENLGG